MERKTLHTNCVTQLIMAVSFDFFTIGNKTNAHGVFQISYHTADDTVTSSTETVLLLLIALCLVFSHAHCIDEMNGKLAYVHGQIDERNKNIEETLYCRNVDRQNNGKRHHNNA